MESEGRRPWYQFPARLSSQKFEGQEAHWKVFAVLVSLGALKDLGSNPTACLGLPKKLFHQEGFRPSIPDGNVPVSFPVSFSTPLLFFISSPSRSIWLGIGLLSCNSTNKSWGWHSENAEILKRGQWLWLIGVKQKELILLGLQHTNGYKV